MATAPRKLVAALWRHGMASAENKAQLVTFKTDALAELANNKGASTLSGSANGVAFALGGNGSLTVGEWFAALDAALVYIEQGTAPPSRTYVRII